VPNLPSAAKRMRQAEKRRLRNKAIRSHAKTMVKKAIKAIDEKAPQDEINARVKEAIRAIDKAVSKGVYHKNEGARRKSRLMAYLNKHLLSKKDESE